MKFFVGLALAVVAIADAHAADSPVVSTTSASGNLDPDCPQIVCAAIMSWEECTKDLPEKCRPKTDKPLTWEERRLIQFPRTNDGGGNKPGVVSSSKNWTCSDICPPDLRSPVCGSDGVKYSNPCELKAAACTNPERNIVTSGWIACIKKSHAN